MQVHDYFSQEATTTPSIPLPPRHLQSGGVIPEAHADFLISSLQTNQMSLWGKGIPQGVVPSRRREQWGTQRGSLLCSAMSETCPNSVLQLLELAVQVSGKPLSMVPTLIMVVIVTSTHACILVINFNYPWETIPIQTCCQVFLVVVVQSLYLLRTLKSSTAL